MITRLLPVNDSLPIDLQVRRANGTFLSLTPFTILVTVVGPTGAPVYSGSLSVGSPNTEATGIIPKDTLTTPGDYVVSVRAVCAASAEAYTAKFIARVS